MGIWAAMFDLKLHVLHDRSFHALRATGAVRTIKMSATRAAGRQIATVGR